MRSPRTTHRVPALVRGLASLCGTVAALVIAGGSAVAQTPAGDAVTPAEGPDAVVQGADAAAPSAGPGPTAIRPSPPPPAGPRGAQAEEPAVDGAVAAATLELDRALRERAAHVRALAAGRLDPAIDPAPLARVSLDEAIWSLPGGQSALAEALAGPQDGPPEADTPGEALGRAWSDLRSLGPGEVADRLRQAAERHRTWREQRAETSARRALLGEALSEAIQSGTGTRDLVPALTIDATAATSDVDRHALAALLRGETAEADPLTVARRAFLELAPERRDLLLEAAAKAQLRKGPGDEAQAAIDEARVASEEAQQAAAERQQALEAARRAQSEFARTLAEEMARLHGVAQAQATFLASWEAQVAEALAHREAALVWRRNVRELEERSVLAGDKEADADRMLGEVREAVTGARGRLGAALDQLVQLPEPPGPGQRLEDRLVVGVDRTALDALADEVAREQARLSRLTLQRAWAVATTLHEDVDLLNEARLALFGMCSPAVRAHLTGFGSEGVRQVQRELQQASLELRFQLRAWPIQLEAIGEDLQTSPIPLLIALLQLALGAVLWRAWRRRAPALIEALAPQAGSGRPGGSGGSPWRERALWVVARSRGPLEWLALLGLVWLLLRDHFPLPGLGVAWQVIAWGLLAAWLVAVVDALSSRGTLATAAGSPLAALRKRSLQLVILTAVGMWVVLGIWLDTVGEGALYAWAKVVSTLAALPLVFVLLRWWREPVFAATAPLASESPWARWATSRQGGALSLIGVAVGAVGLAWRRGRRVVSADLGEREASRRLLAWLFRRQLSKASDDAGADVTEALDPARYEALSPEHPPGADEAGADSIPPSMEPLVRVTLAPRATVSVVVGPRGAGKTTSLRAIARALAPVRCVHVRCHGRPFEQLEHDLLVALGAEPGDRDALIEALRGAAPVALLVDDCHRLVRPTIGGFDALDQLGQLMREAGDGVSMVATMGDAAWQLVARARHHQAFFDRVVRLEPWSEERLGELVRRRAEAAGIAPNFSDLHAVTAGQDAGDEDRAERGYRRVLWDYSGGNPGVALQAWRDSLRLGPRGNVVVRLFEPPSVDRLDELSVDGLFALRALLQLDGATEAEVAASTSLGRSQVSDVLRRALVDGIIEPGPDGLRISWPWLRPTILVLRRKHLLVT